MASKRLRVSVGNASTRMSKGESLACRQRRTRWASCAPGCCRRSGRRRWRSA